MAVGLSILAAMVWGTADFMGGAMSRRRPPAVVLAWGQGAGLVTAILVALAVGGLDHLGDPTLVIDGVVAGACAVAALLCFYTALSIGTMSVVAPISAAGGVVPVCVGLARGEVPATIQGIGVVLAIIGVVLASGPELRGAGGPRAITLAVVAGALAGASITFVAFGSDRSAWSTLVVMRVTGLVVMAMVLVVLRLRPRVSRIEAAPLVAIGVLDVVGNLAYGLATTDGLLAVVAPVASLFAVVTVLLARFVNKERLAGIQNVGIALALIGVAAIAAGSSSAS